MIILFLAIGGTAFLAIDYLMRARVKRRVESMTDAEILAELPRAVWFGAESALHDELERRAVSKLMVERAQ